MENICKSINDIFETEAPADMVTGLEALVGILRNCKQATNVDLELFFADPQKLANKLKRMESHGLKYENVKKHKETMEGVLAAFKVEGVRTNKAKKEFNLLPFAPLIEWGVAFGTAAEIELRKEALEEDIAKLVKQRDQCELALQRNEAISRDITAENMAEYYEGQVKSLTDRKLKID